CKAFAHTAEYDAAIAMSLAAIAVEGDRFERRPTSGPFAPRVDLSLQKIRDLRYGENPHQRAAWYRWTDGASGPGRETSGLGRATMLQGKELSYTNLLDLDTAARIVL